MEIPKKCQVPGLSHINLQKCCLSPKKIVETELSVSTTVSKAGIYQCQITDGTKKIEASTTVQVISGRVSVVAVIR